MRHRYRNNWRDMLVVFVCERIPFETWHVSRLWNKKGNFLIWNVYMQIWSGPTGWSPFSSRRVKVGHVNQNNKKGRRKIHGQCWFVACWLVFRSYRWTRCARTGIPQGIAIRPSRVIYQWWFSFVISLFLLFGAFSPFTHTDMCLFAENVWFLLRPFKTLLFLV